MFIATLNYPGGTALNPTSVGYDWANNYISNLLQPQAVNGMDNAARPWAVLGVLLMSASFGWFFVKFSKVIPVKSAANVIKYGGAIATGMAFLTVIPSQHDRMVTFSSVLTLLVFFYITIFILKSRLTILKICSVIFLSMFYVAAFMYFTRFHLEYLPIMQKAIFVMKIVWILALEYFTTEEDFRA